MNYLQKIQTICGRVEVPPVSGEGTLYLCDDPEAARKLMEGGLPVIALLHEGNKNLEFPGVKYAVEKPEELEKEDFERIYRRLKGLPWDILETKRCLIRETTEEDVDAFYQIYAEPQITKYMENLYPDTEQEKQYVREYIEKVYSFYEFGVWTVTEKNSGEVIGRAGFYYREEYDNPELGFVIGVPWQRKGIAQEVCEAVLAYGRRMLSFEWVNVMVHPENEVSLRLCRKLGFEEREAVVLEGRQYVRMEKNLTVEM